MISLTHCPGCKSKLEASFPDPVQKSGACYNHDCHLHYHQHYFDDSSKFLDMSYVSFTLEKFAVTAYFYIFPNKIVLSPYMTNRIHPSISLPYFPMDLNDIPALEEKLKLYTTFS